MRQRAVSRDTSEALTSRHSFIVRVWKDDDSEEPSPPRWRGQVSKVPDGTCSYAREADEVPTLLAREIDRCGVRLGWTWRLRIRIHEWTSSRRRRK